MSTRRQFTKTLNKIHGVKPGQTAKLPRLLSELKSANAALRAAAVSALHRCFDSSDHDQVFLIMLDSEVDQDVVVALVSALSARNQGSRDAKLAYCLIRSLNRFDNCLGGTRDALGDALLRVMDNLDSVAIWNMSTGERTNRIARIRAELGETNQPNCPGQP